MSGRRHQARAVTGVRLVLDDGLSFLARERERYDAVINTVTTPLYFSSSKLYTRDFFELVKRRLSPDGIYSMWLDGRATQAGARIIFATLAASFPECVVVHMLTGYSQVICSQQAMVARPLAEEEWPPAIRDKLAAHSLTPLTALVEAIVLPKHRLFDVAWKVPVNTFDHPILEYTMAARSLQVDVEKFLGYALLQVDFRRSFAHDRVLDDTELARRCAWLRTLGQGTPFGCLAALGIADSGAAPYEYVRIVLDSMRGTAHPEREKLVRRLLNLGRAREALVELDDIALLEGGRSAPFRLLRARADLDLANGLSDERLADLIRLDPLSSAPRRVAVAALLQRREFGSALHQLSVIQRMGDMTEREHQVATRLRAASLAGAP